MDHTTNNLDLDKLEALAKAAEQMFTGMHWYTRFQILDGIGNDESAALIGALDPDAVLELIALARSAAPVQPLSGIKTWDARQRESEYGRNAESCMMDEIADLRAALSAVEATKGQQEPVAIPAGWKVERNGECMRLRDPDGRTTNFSPLSGPSGKLAYEFLTAILAAPVSAAPTAAEVPSELHQAIARVVELNARRPAWHDLDFAIRGLAAPIAVKEGAGEVDAKAVARAVEPGGTTQRLRCAVKYNESINPWDVLEVVTLAERYAALIAAQPKDTTDTRRDV